jgi:hypothetical protein
MLPFSRLMCVTAGVEERGGRVVVAGVSVLYMAQAATLEEAIVRDILHALGPR